MVPAWWSWLLTALGVLGLWAAGSKQRWGWFFLLAQQPLWVAYALLTKQYGFLFAAVTYGSVYLRNYLAWRKDVAREG